MAEQALVKQVYGLRFNGSSYVLTVDCGVTDGEGGSIGFVVEASEPMVVDQVIWQDLLGL